MLRKLLYLPFIILISCTQKESSQAVFLPSNLTVQIDVSSSTEGLVTVSASADDANYYETVFFHNGGSQLLKTNDGISSFLFTETGTYDIITRAHSSYEHFIQKEDTVSVFVTTNTGGIPAEGYITPIEYAGYNLVWNDEFEGSTLSNDWTQEIGTGNSGWGNNELQYYRAENTEVNDGYLIITAKEEFYNGRNYTSSRMITKNNQSFQYGRIDIRAVLPRGQGMWPALWMLGNSISSVGWPACGEIDIMEMVGGNSGDNRVYGTVHWDNNGQHASFGGSNQLNNGIFSDEFHVFSIVWNSNTIKWYRDDILYNTIDVTPASLSEFHQPYFFIFNLAVGGNWPGPPNNNTMFPQQLVVDYVRVFQLN